MHVSRLVAAFAAVLAFGCADAKAPSYVGTWKLNLAESDFGQLTMMYEPVAGGAMKATMDGMSFTFKTDGSPTPTPWGNVLAFKGVDSVTWQQVNEVNGKVASTDTLRLSSDRSMLTVTSTRMMPDGGSTHDTMTFTRKAGERGLAGTWQAEKMNSSAPSTLQIALEGSDGIALTFVEIQGECHAKTDGKDYPATGPMWASGWTCAVQANTDTGFELSVKKDGSAMYTSSYSVSEDGKKLTEMGGAVSTTEKIKAVYDRQGA